MPFDESMHLLSADPSASPSMSTDDHSSGGPAPDPAAVFQTSILDQVTTRRAVWVALLLALGNMADAVQIMSVGFILAEMDEIPRIQKELISAAVFIGMLLGGIICGICADRFGRKPCLLTSLFANTLAGVLSACTNDAYTLMACLMFGGLGIGGSVPIVFSLGAELFPTRLRGSLLSLIASFWMVGSIFASVSAWVILGRDFNGHKMIAHGTWRYFSVFCTIPVAFSSVLIFFWVPESPEFLMRKGLLSDATKSVMLYTGSHFETKDILPFFNSFRSLTRRSEETQGDDVSKCGEKTFQSLHILLSPAWRRTTITMCLIWFTLCFGSYGLTTWISVLFRDVGLPNAYFDTIIFALANLPGNLISIFYIEKFGRKALLGVGMGLAAISAVGFAVSTKDKYVVVLCASLFNTFSVAGWNALDCLSAEIFPTPVRTSTMGLLSATGHLGAICAQFVNGSLETNVSLLLTVTSVCMFVGGLFSFSLPSEEQSTKITSDGDRRDISYHQTHTHEHTNPMI